MSAYAAELMRDETQDFHDFDPTEVIHVFSSLCCLRDGVPLTVEGMSFVPGCVDVVVSSKRGGVIYTVVRDGFVVWADGRRTTPDQRWDEITD